MTNPTITYNHGFMNDMDSATYWGAANNSADPLTDVTMTSDGDVITITGTADNAAANEYVYYQKAGLSISTDTYPKYLVRWKTGASVGLGAQVNLNFAGGGSQSLLEATGIPQFNTSWTVTTGTLTSARTIQSIDVYADDYPDTVSTGPYSVYYDFILFCQGTFTFPFVYPDGIKMTFPNRYADLGPPGRVGNITQYLGMDSPIITLGGNMDTSTSWELSSVDLGVLYNIMYYAYLDPWQWFTSDLYNCKVTPRNFTISQDSNPTAVKKWSLELKKYTLIQPTTDFSPMTW